MAIVAQAITSTFQASGRGKHDKKEATPGSVKKDVPQMPQKLLL